jgi:hypothetical protein
VNIAAGTAGFPPEDKAKAADAVAPDTPSGEVHPSDEEPEPIGQLLAGAARSSLGFVLAACAPIAIVIALGASDPFLDLVGTRAQWLSIAAVAMTSLATASCATHWRVRPTRLLALTFAVAALYMLWVLEEFVPSRHEWILAQRVTWVAIPLIYVFWTRTAVNIAYHLRPDPTILGIYKPVHRLRAWSRWPKPLPWKSVPTAEIAVSWAPAFALIVAGLSQPSWFKHDHREIAGESWLGWTYSPAGGFKILAVWGFALVSGASLVLIGAWRTRRRPLPPGLLERARWATRASAVFLVVDAVILWRATKPHFSESLLDALLALGVLGFALLTLDAEQYDTSLSAYTTLGRRAVTSGGWLVVVLVATKGYAGDPISRGIFAGVLAMVYPLAPIWVRAFEGLALRAPTGLIESTQTADDAPGVGDDGTAAPNPIDTDVGAGDLDTAAAASAWSAEAAAEERPAARSAKPLDPSLKIIPSREEIEMLRVGLGGVLSKFEVDGDGLNPQLVTWARACLEAISEEEFRQLAGALQGAAGSHPWTFGRPGSENRRNALLFFLHNFPALDPGTPNQRTTSFVRLIYESARGPEHETEASQWRWLRFFCLERGALSADATLRAAEEAELLRMRIYMLGVKGVVYRPELGRDGPSYKLAELEEIETEDLVPFLQRLPKTQDRAKVRTRTRLVRSTLSRIRRSWLDALGASPDG